MELTESRKRDIAVHVLVGHYRKKGIMVGADTKRQVGSIANQLKISQDEARSFIGVFVRLLMREMFMSRAELERRDMVNAPSAEREEERASGLLPISEERLGELCLAHVGCLIRADNVRIGSSSRDEILTEAKRFGIPEEELMAFYRPFVESLVHDRTSPRK